MINRGIFPGFFTMGNAVCGFLSILSAFEGNFSWACWFIILAGFLDALDGKVARLSRTTSQFGVELDSLADFLSFGVAPAILLYATKLNTLGKWGWILSVIYIMASSYRLARFNLMADTEEKREFLGLPVPAAALVLVSFVVMCMHLYGELRYDELLIAMIFLCSFLMVSQVQYDALPDRFNSWYDRFKVAVLAVFLIVIVISVLVNGQLFNYRVLLFPFIGLYILSGIVREFLRLSTVGVGKVTRRPYRRRASDRVKDRSDGDE
ncbi:MAG: CDP-diacylglycerol--serine O-phosphatidyltransferase [Candidatus Zixiibacteriota bacterium]|nr:MAG: CDP-diacylglycerol--serine O-phosphatidyltransferase [candidate division Zixibacteria bacterium]